MKKSHLAAITFSMVLALLLSFSVTSAQTIDPTEWKYRKQITIPASEDLTGFPLLVDIDDADLAAYAQTDGDDIVFTEGDGINKLPYEIESYNGTTGHLVAWVSVSLSSIDATDLYMYYGNDAASPPPIGSEAEMWDDNYEGVWHLDDASNLIDSTGNGHNGASYFTTDVFGKVDGAQSFDGTDYIDCGDIDITGSRTVEAWVYSNSGTGIERVLAQDRIGQPGQFMLWILANGQPEFRVASGTTWYKATGPQTIDGGQWTHVLGVYDDDSDSATPSPKVKLYINGVNVAEATAPGPINSYDLNFTIGASSFVDGYPQDHFWDGIIDEVRISSEARSLEWIETAFNNQSDPGSFYTMGIIETEYPIVSNPDPADNAIGVPISTTQLCFDLEDQQGNTLSYTVTSGIGSDSGNAIYPYVQPYCSSVSGLDYDTYYEWTVTVDDGNGHETIKTYSFTTEREPGPWWDCAWDYRKAIIIDPTKVPEDFTNFPLLVDTTLPSTAQPNGDDIVFTDYNGNQLFHEIESTDGGQLVAWVNVPLSSSEDTYLYMYYGNPDPPIAGNPTLVWSNNYRGVWHLDDASDLIDSTGNGHTGASYFTTNVFGKVDGAQSFDGTDYIDCGDIDIPGSMTVEAWVYSDSATGRERALAKDRLGQPGQFILWINDAGVFEFQVADASDNWYRALGPPITPGQWTHVLGVYDNSVNPSKVKLYIDGVLVKAVDGPDLIDSNDLNFTIGASSFYGGSSGDFWDGIIDEVRISTEAKSAGWIETEYHNQDNPSSFLVIGDEETPEVVVGITAPVDPVQVNDLVEVIVELNDFYLNDAYITTIDWGDSSTDSFFGVLSEIVETHEYTEAGVYTITVTVDDDVYDPSCDEAMYQYVVVYDPDGGFVTGGGWIDSPEGAYTPDPELTGKANFGFVSKYKKGATVPTGQTQFQFKVADLNFHSDTYEWLVIAGARAQYKGTGTINGEGNYGFMLTAIDEKLTPSTDVDRFRIKICDKDDGDAIVYDNQMDADDDAEPATGIGGGSIVIHKGKK